ncbi:hypothetical protein Tfer_1387 [Thermincola ferriacetica]|uniref:ABC-2 transporter permease n=1 Tax=Thermincola ferriacetica TaxID=281456 RepID=A0A0L6W4I4_9FIRM|nr:ABC-2 transporter permease [Thermincola ferriacetica]KNZ70004.1 hypothetical protein Tfer_1387 [Thermincola ferriacetica]
MLNLIKKDFCVQKKTFLLAVFYSAFVFVAFHTMRQAAYIMGSLAIAYLFIMNANHADDKNRSEILINSLPIDRKKIVAAKYLAALVFTVIGILLTGVTGAIFKTAVEGAGLALSFRFINGFDMVSTFMSVGLLISLYYPLYFKFGYNFARKINAVLFMLIFFLTGFLVGVVKAKDDSQVVGYITDLLQNTYLWMTLSTGAVVALVMISLAVSVKLYMNKEF